MSLLIYSDPNIPLSYLNYLLLLAVSQFPNPLLLCYFMTCSQDYPYFTLNYLEHHFLCHFNTLFVLKVSCKGLFFFVAWKRNEQRQLSEMNSSPRTQGAVVLTASCVCLWEDVSSLGQELFAFGSLHSAKSIVSTLTLITEVARQGTRWQLPSSRQELQQQRAQRHHPVLKVLDPCTLIILVFNESMSWHAALWLEQIFHGIRFSSSMTALLLQRLSLTTVRQTPSSGQSMLLHVCSIGVWFNTALLKLALFHSFYFTFYLLETVHGERRIGKQTGTACFVGVWWLRMDPFNPFVYLFVAQPHDTTSTWLAHTRSSQCGLPHAMRLQLSAAAQGLLSHSSLCKSSPSPLAYFFQTVAELVLLNDVGL